MLLYLRMWAKLKRKKKMGLGETERKQKVATRFFFQCELLWIKTLLQTQGMETRVRERERGNAYLYY